VESGLTKAALAAADGDGARALLAAVRVLRWQLIAGGEIEPLEDEWLPEFVEAELARRAA
jgi:hypothetical protein